MCCIYFQKANSSTVIWQLRHKLTTILNDAKAPLDVIAFTAISLGLIYVGSCNEEVAQAIIFALMDRSESELGEPLTRLIPLGLGLLYLGKQVKYWWWFAFVESITFFYSFLNLLCFLYTIVYYCVCLSSFWVVFWMPFGIHFVQRYCPLRTWDPQFP